MNASLRLDQQIERILSFIETAERLIYQEKMVDVSALQAHIANLCDELDKMPKQDAKKHAAQLEKLFEAMERLEKDLDMQHDALTEQLQPRTQYANPLLAQEIEDDPEQTS